MRRSLRNHAGSTLEVVGFMRQSGCVWLDPYHIVSVRIEEAMRWYVEAVSLVCSGGWFCNSFGNLRRDFTNGRGDLTFAKSRGNCRSDLNIVTGVNYF